MTEKRKAKKSQDQKLFDEYLQYMENSDLVSAIGALDELIKITPVKALSIL